MCKNNIIRQRGRNVTTSQGGNITQDDRCGNEQVKAFLRTKYVQGFKGKNGHGTGTDKGSQKRTISYL